jgi:alpha-1,6-mannosyltransferase
VGRVAGLGRRVRAADPGLRRAGFPLRLLDLTEFYSAEGGGVRTYLSAKIDWIARQPDIEHVLVVPGRGSERSRAGRTTTYTLAGPPAPGSPGYRVLWNAAQIRRIVAEERPDVIELGSVYTAPWLLRTALRAHPAPVAGFVHMDLPGAVERQTAQYRDWVAAFATAAAAAYLRRAYSRCNALVVTSNAARAALLRAGLPEPHVVPMGTDLDSFRPDRRDPSWREELGIDDDRPVGLYVGRLAGEKDVEVLVNALPELHRRTGMTVAFMGDGRLRSRLEALERERPEQLRVLGFEADPDRLARAYATTDVCFAPCPHETFGLAVLEAAACGTRLVGAGAGAVGELLEGSAWGRTFIPGDPPSLVEAVVVALALDREAVAREARRAAQEYSWDRTFTQLFEVYRNLVG